MELRFLDILSPQFVGHYGKNKGIYLITTQNYFHNGICKVGLTNASFNSRFKSYRSHYAFVEQIYCFGLIIMDDKASIRTIEKQILKEFAPLRLNYPDTERLTEWIRIDVQTIQTAFNNLKNAEGVIRVETEFGALKHAPPLNIVEKVIRNPRKQTQVQLIDGTVLPATNGLANLQKKLSPHEVKVIRDMDAGLFQWLKQHGIEIQEIADEIRACYTDNQIEEKGGLEDLIVFLAREARTRNENDARFIRNIKRIARLES